jgi:hypothetical protein
MGDAGRLARIFGGKQVIWDGASTALALRCLRFRFILEVLECSQCDLRDEMRVPLEVLKPLLCTADPRGVLPDLLLTATSLG